MEKYYLYNTITINSIFHFLFPLILGLILKAKWKWGVLILIAFELVENLSGYTLIIKGWEIFSPEPFINIVADVIIGTIGLYVGYKLTKLKN